jgi:hypothetical protein
MPSSPFPEKTMFRIAFTMLFSATLLTLQPDDYYARYGSVVRSGAPEIEEGLYNFQYDSWVRTNDDGRFRFVRAIQNLKLTPLWVDWEKTGVRGHTNSRGALVCELDSDTRQHVLIETKLWYGTKLNPKDKPSSYREVAKAAGADPKENDKPQSAGTLRSRARMALVPNSKDIPVDVDIEMESSVTEVGDGAFLYIYRWRNQIAKKTPERIFVALDKEARDKFQFDANSAEFPIELSSSFKGAYLKFASKVASARSPVHDVIHIEFRFGKKGGEVAGGAPMSIYRPMKID